MSKFRLLINNQLRQSGQFNFRCFFIFMINSNISNEGAWTFLLMCCEITIITGGGSGIGKSIAILFARHGAQVHIPDINEVEEKAVCDKLLKQGFKCQFHRADVTQLADVASMALYLCSDLTTFITGCNFPVDGRFISVKI
jgi:NAD(P)-dependent dehydrogenase (short-subunit alcohol dehydrogenase family)